jgi:hypothetical protein
MHLLNIYPIGPADKSFRIPDLDICFFSLNLSLILTLSFGVHCIFAFIRTPSALIVSHQLCTTFPSYLSRRVVVFFLSPRLEPIFQLVSAHFFFLRLFTRRAGKIRQALITTFVAARHVHIYDVADTCTHYGMFLAS